MIRMIQRSNSKVVARRQAQNPTMPATFIIACCGEGAGEICPLA